MYFPSILLCVLVVTVNGRGQFALNEHWVCGVKQSCLECLQLPQCSWCGSGTDNKCFSRQLADFNCKNETIVHVDYGLSFVENAECSCANGKMNLQCYPPGVTEGPQCSGRGECICGHCVCDSTPDVNYPTKIVMGEYCEFDNFSCDGPKCTEGPYSLSQSVVVDDDEIDNTVANTESK